MLLNPENIKNRGHLGRALGMGLSEAAELMLLCNQVENYCFPTLVKVHLLQAAFPDCTTHSSGPASEFPPSSPLTHTDSGQFPKLFMARALVTQEAYSPD